MLLCSNHKIQNIKDEISIYEEYLGVVFWKNLESLYISCFVVRESKGKRKKIREEDLNRKLYKKWKALETYLKRSNPFEVSVKFTVNWDHAIALQ